MTCCKLIKIERSSKTEKEKQINKKNVFYKT